jgi:voltage-gated potassium channel
MDFTAHRTVTHRLFHHRPFRNALTILIALSVFLGMLIVPIESGDPHARIHTLEEGIWWAITTVTGVGYGDYVPVTATGRVVGMVLMFVGAIIFGLIVGIIGITMTKRQEEYVWFKLFDRLDQLDDKLKKLEKENAELMKHVLPKHNEQRSND